MSQTDGERYHPEDESNGCVYEDGIYYQWLRV